MKNKTKTAELVDEQTKQTLQTRFMLDKNFNPIRIAIANGHKRMFNTLYLTGHRSSEVLTTKHYTKKAGA